MQKDEKVPLFWKIQSVDKLVISEGVKTEFKENFTTGCITTLWQTWSENYVNFKFLNV